MSRTFAKRVVHQYLGWVHTMRSPKCKHKILANNQPKYCDELNLSIEFRTPTVVTSWDDIYSTKRRVKMPIESKLDNKFWVTTGYVPSIEQNIARLQVYIEDAERSLAYHQDVINRLDAVKNEEEIKNWYLADFWRYTNSFNTIHKLKWQLEKFKAELEKLRGKNDSQKLGD